MTPQRFLLDPATRLAYLAVGIIGCRPAEPALVPAGAGPIPAEQVESWVAMTEPKAGALHRFRWLYQDEQSSKGGRGSARISPPDTLRFDFAGSLGIGKGSALVVGDTAVWVVPERSVEDLVPSFPLLWALFGVARPPGPRAAVQGSAGPVRTAWRYAAGRDTVEYLRVSGEPVRFYAEVRRDGKVIGRTQATLGADGAAIKARLTVPSAPAKLEITFYETKPTSGFPAATWDRPER